MEKERQTRAVAYKALVDAGFALVQRDPRLSGLSPNSRPDLVAWAANDAGALVPWAVVEVQSAGKNQRPEFAGPTLAHLRDRLGTVEHYVVTSDGSWHRADGALQSFEPVDGPASPPNLGEGSIDDIRFVTDLLSSRVWRAADTARGELSPDRYLSLVTTEIESLKALRSEEGVDIPITRDALFRAARTASVEFAGRARSGSESISDPTVTAAIARLAAKHLTGTVLDPFCGLGTFLWESIDVAREGGTALQSAIGVEINLDIAQIASAIGAASAVPVDISHGQALDVEVPQVEAVVSSPPMGMRLNEAHRLLDGRETKQGDLAYLDHVLTCLKPGGRAVVHVGTSLTFRQDAASYREFLAREFRIAALIGLPSGSVPGSGIRSVILVIDRSQPTETFVAQLGDDWREQLAPGGAALEAALQHVDGEASK